MISKILPFSCGHRFTHTGKLLTMVLKQEFRAITPQDYLQNQREAQLAKRPHTATLKPLQKNNQGDDLIEDEIKLIGTPKGQPYEPYPDFDTFQQVLTQGQRDLIFLQIDPSSYMARERFMSHRCAMGEVQDYRLDGVRTIDPHKPITWQQTVVNLLTVDMLRQNKLPKEINYRRGLYAYSYPYVLDDDLSDGLKNNRYGSIESGLQPKKQIQALNQTFVNEISSQILGGKRTGYDMMDKILYSSLMGKHKVMLGGMPQTLCRMILGQSLSIHEVRDIFRLIMEKNNKLTVPYKTSQACEQFLPHVFNLPKDLYMTAMLKESFQAATQMVAVVGIQNWRPIQQYWVPPPYGINMTEATKVPQGFAGETVEDLIEKQAIFDVLLETRTWSKGYLSNPFPYLFEDITKVEKKDLQHYKKTFLKYYHMYSDFKKRETKELPEGAHSQKPQLLTSAKASSVDRQRSEEMSKIMNEQNKEDFSLKHLKTRMDLQFDKKIKKSIKL